MNCRYSSLSKKQYLTALRRCFSSPFAFYDERVTGMVLGSFFAVAHYQGYEWNRKITDECNRAYGFVKEREGQLEICYFCWKGLLSPGWIAVYTILCRVIFLFFEIENQEPLGDVAWIVSVILSLVVGAATAIGHSLTESGALGAEEVKKLLTDPENYYC